MFQLQWDEIRFGLWVGKTVFVCLTTQLCERKKEKKLMILNLSAGIYQNSCPASLYYSMF